MTDNDQGGRMASSRQVAFWVMALVSVCSVGCVQAVPDSTVVPATTVDASGATLSGGGVTLRIPAGALEAPVPITVTRLGTASEAGLPRPTAPGLVGTVDLVGATFAFTPHATAFKSPVAVEIALAKAGDKLLRLDDPSDTTWELVGAAAPSRTSRARASRAARPPG